ncbi:MAG: energy-coupling factor transporter transmembrane component T [Chloroflexota bacterium]
MLDPRTKLLLALLFSTLVVMTADLTTLGAECGLALLAVIGAGLLRAWWRMVRLLVPMFVFLVLFTVLALDMATAVGGVVRLLAISTAFFLFFQTTAPEDLGNALVASGVPYAFTFILTSAMQFVPVIARRAREILDAQRARGIRLERDAASLRNYPALLAPLLIQSFTLADQLAEAMEARGFGSPRRTFAREYRWRTWDYAAVIVGVAAAVGFWLLQRLIANSR